MYFLSKGKVAILSDEGQETATLYPGSYFGEIALLYSDKRTASVVALTFCDVLMLTKDQFEYVLQQFPREREQINNVAKDRIIAHRKRKLIRRLPFLNHSNPEFTDAIVPHMTYKIYKKGEYIIKEKEAGNEMYFLDKGSVEVSLSDGSVLSTIPEGGFFGEIALLYDSIRTANVSATSDIETFCLTREHFDLVLKSFPLETERIKKTAEVRRSTTKQKEPKQ